MKYSLSPREIPRPKPKGLPDGLGYISSYIPTWVTMQKFSITTPALTFLGDQYWKNCFSVLLCLLGNRGKYSPGDWAILEIKISILQCLVIESILYLSLIGLPWQVYIGWFDAITIFIVHSIMVLIIVLYKLILKKGNLKEEEN